MKYLMFALSIIININHGICFDRQTISYSPDTLIAPNSRSTISVISPIDGVRIFIDTAYIGIAPQESIQVSSGLRIMRFIHPDYRNWFFQTVVETVQLEPGEHTICKVKFPNLRRISTNPFNAIVEVGDSVHGTTPIMIPTSGEDLSITISKNGFESIAATLDRNRQRFHIDLQRPEISDMSKESFYLTSINTKKYTSVYLSAGATVLAGAAAAFFKIKADNFYNDYKQNGDPKALERVHSFDTASGVSLIVAEMSFFFFSYLLFSQ